MTTLYLVRHGETEENAAMIMQGQTQGRLSREGERQARQLAERLDGTHIDAFVSSDLKRAFDTAAIIAGRRRMAVAVTPLLRERDWGDFTGRYIPDLKDEPWPENVETADSLCERARRFIGYIKREYPGKCVLAVGHGIINKAVQAVCHGKPMGGIARMDNAEVRVLVL
jgi:probable phosphoglycerate mutase